VSASPAAPHDPNDRRGTGGLRAGGSAPASAPSPAPVPTESQVHIERVLDAPPALVFSAWTDRAHMERWYAPNGCIVRFLEMDVRVGGTIRSVIANPHHGECWCRGIYREVVPGQRLVFTMGITDAQGRPVEPKDVGMDPEWPRETVVTVTFEPHGRGTKVTLDQTVAASTAQRTGALPSWLQMFDRLAEVLAP
jgi:uncharacterized protein YndB with AHSA1/START domain